MGKSSDETGTFIIGSRVTSKAAQDPMLPITVDEHLDLLKNKCFQMSEILWLSCMQAEFFTIK
jgi:hypothetical protein